MAEATATAIQTYKTGAVKSIDSYLTMVTKAFTDQGLTMDKYQSSCCINALNSINDLLVKENMKITELEQNPLSTILFTISYLKLNSASTPREVYFQVRKNKTKGKKESQREYKTIEMGIEGAGNDAILRNFGVDVKSVMNPIIVHEGDELTLPYFDGDKMQPCTWRPKSYQGKVKAVVYVITKKDNTKEFLIAEREEVAHNLQAHITNNLRNVPDKLKNPIIERIQNMTLDEMLNDKELQNKLTYKNDFGYDDTCTPISPAWTQASSREAMIERKLRNNAIKKYPKDFSNTEVRAGYESTFEDYDQYRDNKEPKPSYDYTQKEVKAEIENKANTTPLNVIGVNNAKKAETLAKDEKNNILANDSQEQDTPITPNGEVIEPQANVDDEDVPF